MALRQLVNSHKILLRVLIFLSIFSGLFSHVLAQTSSATPQLRASAADLLASSNPPSALPRAEPTPLNHSKVFVAYDEQVLSSGWTINAAVVRKMLDALICAVTAQQTPTEAWRSLVKTGEHGDRIGIKVATEPGLLSGTHYELVQAIVSELIAAGVKPEKIIIWDRRRQDLESAGYIKQSGLHLQWMEHGSGYDPKTVFSSPLIGQLVYGDFEFRESPQSFKDWLNHSQEQFSNDSHYALVLSRQIDKVINVPSLCDSSYSGINGALANMTLGTIDNWRRFAKPPYFGDPAIAELYASELIHHKVIMTMMDGLALQYAGGPGPNPSHTIPYKTLFVSRDPVAIDATAIRLIDEERCNENLPKLGGIESHVQSAEAAGLGNAAEEKIEMIKLHLPYGMQKDSQSIEIQTALRQTAEGSPKGKTSENERVKWKR